MVDVPLVVAGPGIPPGQRIEARAELMDVGPTLLELTGLEVPTTFVGRSFAGALTGGESPRERIVFGETGPSFLTPQHRLFSATLGAHRLIRKRTLEGELVYEEAYDLAADPDERDALDPAELETLRAQLNEYEALERETEEGGPAFHDPSELKGLGYFGEDDEE